MPYLTTFTPKQFSQLRDYQQAYAAALLQIAPYSAQYAEVMTEHLEVADVILTIAEQASRRICVSVTAEGVHSLTRVVSALWHLLDDPVATTELCQNPAAAELVERVSLSELDDMMEVLGVFQHQAVSA